MKQYHFTYRENKKKNKIKGIIKFIGNNKLLTFYFIILIILLYTTVFGSKGLLKRIRLEKEKSSIEEQIQAEIKKTEELQKEINDLKNSDAKIEKIARERYKMTKEGEKIYKVIIDSTK